MNYAMLTIRRIYRNSSLDCFIYRKSVRASFLIVVETEPAVIHQVWYAVCMECSKINTNGIESFNCETDF